MARPPAAQRAAFPLTFSSGSLRFAHPLQVMGSFPFIFVVGNVLLWAFCISSTFHWDERVVPMWTVFAPFSIIAGIR